MGPPLGGKFSTLRGIRVNKIDNVVASSSPLWCLPLLLQYKDFLYLGFGFNGYLLVSKFDPHPTPSHLLVWIFLLVESLLP